MNRKQIIHMSKILSTSFALALTASACQELVNPNLGGQRAGVNDVSLGDDEGDARGLGVVPFIPRGSCGPGSTSPGCKAIREACRRAAKKTIIPILNYFNARIDVNGKATLVNTFKRGPIDVCKTQKNNVGRYRLGRDFYQRLKNKLVKAGIKEDLLDMSTCIDVAGTCDQSSTPVRINGYTAPWGEGLINQVLNRDNLCKVGLNKKIWPQPMYLKSIEERNYLLRGSLATKDPNFYPDCYAGTPINECPLGKRKSNPLYTWGPSVCVPDNYSVDYVRIPEGTEVNKGNLSDDVYAYNPNLCHGRFGGGGILLGCEDERKWCDVQANKNFYDRFLFHGGTYKGLKYGINPDNDRVFSKIKDESPQWLTVGDIAKKVRSHWRRLVRDHEKNIPTAPTYPDMANPPAGFDKRACADLNPFALYDFK